MQQLVFYTRVNSNYIQVLELKIMFLFIIFVENSSEYYLVCEQKAKGIVLSKMYFPNVFGFHFKEES